MLEYLQEQTLILNSPRLALINYIYKFYITEDLLREILFKALFAFFF